MAWFAPANLPGQELEPRTYAQVPTGVNFIAVGYGFSTDNEDFFGGNLLSQRPLHVLKGHVIYSFRPGFWTAFGAGWGNGGQTFVNDLARQTLQSNWRFRWSLAYPITSLQGIVFGLGSAVTRRAGGDYDTISIAYQYAWGGKG